MVLWIKGVYNLFGCDKKVIVQECRLKKGRIDKMVCNCARHVFVTFAMLTDFGVCEGEIL